MVTTMAAGLDFSRVLHLGPSGAHVLTGDIGLMGLMGLMGLICNLCAIFVHTDTWWKKVLSVQVCK